MGNPFSKKSRNDTLVAPQRTRSFAPIIRHGIPSPNGTYPQRPNGPVVRTYGGHYQSPSPYVGAEAPNRRETRVGPVRQPMPPLEAPVHRQVMRPLQAPVHRSQPVIPVLTNVCAPTPPFKVFNTMSDIVVCDRELLFRSAKIFPTVDDIRRESSPQLSPNLIHDSYRCGDHYLSTQFNLLREELVHPLVEDVAKVKKCYADYHKQIPTKTLKAVICGQMADNVFFDVRLRRQFVDRFHGLVLKFTFDMKGFDVFDMNETQKLMSGSLVCMSSDGFHDSVIIGVVVESKLKLDPKNPKSKELGFSLRLDFDNSENRDLFGIVLKPDTEYIAIQAKTYYEGIRHSLARLQTMNENFALKRYIVDVNTDINSPPYLKPDTCYDMRSIISDPLQVFLEDDHDLSLLSSDKVLVKSYQSMVRLSTSLDTKQLDAFYRALTKQFAVIQGPPGTGKTYIGQKIVKCLLDNEKVWNKCLNCRPILIVCYKNHGLDQFLEGIIKFNVNVVRIGGKCESEALDDYRLRTIENKLLTTKYKNLSPESQRLRTSYNSLFEMRRKIQDLTKCLNQLFKSIELSFEQILDFDDIKPYIMPKKFVDELSKYKAFPPKDVLHKWLATKDDNFTLHCNQYLKRRQSSSDMTDKVMALKVMAIEVKKFNQLITEEKWLLYTNWREEYIKEKQRTISVLSESVDDYLKDQKTIEVKLHQRLCRRAQVIGLTITGAAKHRRLVELLDPKIMIVEEAAEVLEGHVVAAMSSNIEHLILIGDHKQLRPITSARHLTDRYSLDKSLFERMVLNRMPFDQLELQYRMRPCISELLNVAHIYDKKLSNDQRVAKYPIMKFMRQKNMFFVDHNSREDKVVVRSRSNRHEALFVVELVRYFLLRRYPDTAITVLTTYNAQLSLIKNIMFDQKFFIKEQVKDENKPNAPDEPSELRVRVSTVDGFQGEENDIIIISYVRSNEMSNIGFLSNMNRMNVSLSRARHALYCIGNFEMMAKQSPQMWAKIVEHLKAKKCFGKRLTIGCQCMGFATIRTHVELSEYNSRLRSNNYRCLCSQ